MEVVLYSTGCPRCHILKKKLEAKGIAYTENNDVDEMGQLGINAVPVLAVNGDLLEFAKAVNWINSQQGDVNEY